MAIRQRLRPPRAGQVAVDTVPLVVLGDNDLRDSGIVVNLGPATVYLSFDPNVTQYSGFALPPGAGFGFTSTRALYVVAAGSGSTISFIEESG